jgi:putative transposase
MIGQGFFFGDIKNGQMIYNEFGEYAKQCWREIPVHFPHVKLDDFVVMPNHVHGIICINGGSVVGVQNFEPLHFKPLHYKPRHFEPLHESRYTSNSTRNQFQHIIPRSIGSIIRGYKIGVSKMVRQQIPDIPVWQRNYFEHVIRDEKSLYFIRNYIRENPLNWNSDSKTHIERELHKLEFLKESPKRTNLH